jgi:hypothetical protein
MYDMPPPSPPLSCPAPVSLPLLQVKAAGAAATLIAMYFTGHIERAYERGGSDGSVPMLSSFLIFMSLSVM